MFWKLRDLGERLTKAGVVKTATAATLDHLKSTKHMWAHEFLYNNFGYNLFKLYTGATIDRKDKTIYIYNIVKKKLLYMYILHVRMHFAQKRWEYLQMRSFICYMYTCI